MNKKNKAIFFNVLLFLCFSTVLYADTDLSIGMEKVKLNFRAYGHFWAGQIGRGTGPDGVLLDMDELWTEEAFTLLSLEALYKKHLRIIAGIEVAMYFSWPQEKDFNITKKARRDVGTGPCYMNITFPETRAGDFDFYIGYFDYKYNRHVKNLGEFMFRSGTYPAYIITYFDYPLAKLLGFRFSHKLFDNSLSYDLIFNSETDFYPSMDWTLSLLGRYDFLNRGFFELGAGVSFAHLISVYSDKYDKSGLGSLTDPVDKNPSGNMYIKENGDTAFYTFRGTKVMCRFSLNPLALFKNTGSYFGKEDCKIYAEAIIIGIKSYPDTTAFGAPQPSYSKWQEKIPITFGINIPTFKLIDVLSLEFEWWNSKYYNDYRDIYIISSLPNAPAQNPNIDESPWKWSLYARKTFFDGHFAIIGQVARDHMRLPSSRYEKANHREMLIEQGDWWWTTKFAFSF